MGEPETHGERPETAGPVVMWQRWDDLLFLHWEFDPRVIQATLPPGLTVDTHAGRAWVGVVPFRMAAVRPRVLPPVPGLSWFWELNVRTYVRDVRGRPGVWFYSLDCDQPLACAIARRFFHLNYRDADMACGVEGSGWRDFSSRCRDEAASARLKSAVSRRGAVGLGVMRDHLVLGIGVPDKIGECSCFCQRHEKRAAPAGAAP